MAPDTKKHKNQKLITWLRYLIT